MWTLWDLFPASLKQLLASPKIKGYYKWNNSRERFTGIIKPKYHFCWKTIDSINITIFVVSTSQDYRVDYPDHFSYSLSCDIDIFNAEQCKKISSDVWYIYSWTANGIFTELKVEHFEKEYNKSIILLWELKDEKFKELDTLLKTKKAKENLKKTVANSGIDGKLIEDLYAKEAREREILEAIVLKKISW